MSSSILYTALQNSRVTIRARNYGINIFSTNRTKREQQWCSTANTKKKVDALLSITWFGVLKKRILWSYSSGRGVSYSMTNTFYDVASRCWTKKDRLIQIKLGLSLL